jgi:adenosylmethionine-8-amino-7-oxononanoate aminotransferase
MPPLCITYNQLTQAVEALRAAITAVWLRRKAKRINAEKVTA